MQKFNRKKRAEIYLKAAELVEDKSNKVCFGSCCWAIQESTSTKYETLDSLLMKQFDEFFLFEPDNYEGVNYWWQLNNEGNKCRTIALLFAHQMALNP